VTKPVLSQAEGAAHYPGKPACVPARGLGTLSLALLTAALAACGGHEAVRANAAAPSRHWATVAPADPAASNAVLMRAISLVGTPYRYGGNTPESGFDCSGLVNYVYRDMLDLRLPRTSRDLAAWQGPRIAPDRLTAADLVFFGSGSQVNHVGIYVGDGRFVHAPRTGRDVTVSSLDGYWGSKFLQARRVAGI
jgi:cell wall-associated NlpC family hydrolase